MVKLSACYYKKVVNNYGISHFYAFQLDNGVDQIETSVPDGCIDIIFQYDLNGNNAGASVYGSPLQPHSFDMTSGCRYFGVRFLPGNSPMLVDASMSELINQVLPLCDNNGTNRQLTEMIAHCDDFERQAQLFLEYYRQELRKKQRYSGSYMLNQFLLKEILQHCGNIKISDLAENSGYSVRYVNKVFKEEEGISLKNFSRIIRFQSCMSAITHTDAKTWEDSDGLIARLGYCDQSHLIREFKEFSKRTPGNYLSELKAFGYKHRLKIV